MYFNVYLLEKLFIFGLHIKEPNYEKSEVVLKLSHI